MNSQDDSTFFSETRISQAPIRLIDHLERDKDNIQRCFARKEVYEFSWQAPIEHVPDLQRDILFWFLAKGAPYVHARYRRVGYDDDKLRWKITYCNESIPKNIKFGDNNATHFCANDDHFIFHVCEETIHYYLRTTKTRILVKCPSLIGQLKRFLKNYPKHYNNLVYISTPQNYFRNIQALTICFGCHPRLGKQSSVFRFRQHTLHETQLFQVIMLFCSITI